MFPARAVSRLSGLVHVRNFTVSGAVYFKPKITTPERPNLYELYEGEEITLDGIKQDKHGVFHKYIQNGLHSMNYNKLTPVQERTILPILQEEKGLVARAKTGTGKTMAFVVPLVQHSMDVWGIQKLKRPQVNSFVIAPTRDLATQIFLEFRRLTTHDKNLKTRVDVRLWTGGMSTRRPWGSEVPQIIVATPGRALYWLREHKWRRHFSQLDYRVFDEADRILDQGFSEDLAAIDELIKGVRRENYTGTLKNVMFSATMDDNVWDFAKENLGEEFKYIDCVDPNEEETHLQITQKLVKTKSLFDTHVAAISDVIRKSSEPGYKSIVFVPTTAAADFTYSLIRSAQGGSGAKMCWPLHGKMTQSARDNSVRQFKRCTSGILVATDVAARGMDFQKVTEVVQLNASRETADYVHKIGRTGRAGASGTATLYMSENEMPFVQALRKQRDIKFNEEVVYEPTEDDLALFGKAEIDEYKIDDYISSVFGFQSMALDAYKGDRIGMVNNVVDLFRKLSGDTAAFHMSNRLFENLSLPRTVIPDLITVPDASNLRLTKRAKMLESGNSKGYQNKSKYGKNDRYSKGNNRYQDNDRRSNNRLSKRSFDSKSGDYGRNNDGYSPRKSYNLNSRNYLNFENNRNSGYNRDSGYSRDSGYNRDNRRSGNYSKRTFNQDDN